MASIDQAASPQGVAGASEQTARSTALGEWRRSWPVALVCTLGFGASSLVIMSFGAFVGPLQAEFGWSRSAISGALILPTMIATFAPVLTGAAVDRFGARPMAVLGALAVGAATSLFATATGSVFNWYLLWAVYSLSSQLMSPILWSGAIASVFAATRGMALSITMSGSALVAMVGPAVANWLIEDFGFRTAYVVLGTSTGLFLAIMSALVMPRRKPPAPPLPTAEAAAVEDAPAPVAAPFVTALRSATFLKLAFMIFFGHVVVLALFVHLIPLLSGSGLSRQEAVLVAGSFGLAMLTGKLVVGVSVDRFSAPLLLGLLCAMMAGGFAMLSTPSMTTGWAMTSVVLYGVAYGGIGPIFPYMIARYFGVASFGRLYGALCCVSAAAFGIGPVVAGLVYDTTHSYRLLLLGAVPVLAVAVLLAFSLPKHAHK